MEEGTKLKLPETLSGFIFPKHKLTGELKGFTEGAEGRKGCVEKERIWADSEEGALLSGDPNAMRLPVGLSEARGFWKQVAFTPNSGSVHEGSKTT